MEWKSQRELGLESDARMPNWGNWRDCQVLGPGDADAPAYYWDRRQSARFWTYYQSDEPIIVNVALVHPLFENADA